MTITPTFDNVAEPNGRPGAVEPMVGVAKGVGAFSDNLTGANTELKTRLRPLARVSACDILQHGLKFQWHFCLFLAEMGMRP